MPPRHLVVGATGKTGRLLVRQLLDRGHGVRVIVRSPDRLPAEVRDHPDLDAITAPLLDLSDDELAGAARGCAAIASCLGHSVSARGIWGPPRRLCTDAVRRLVVAIRATHPTGEPPTRFVLMSTVGVRDPRLGEPRSIPEHVILALLRVLVPPHADNEQAAAALLDVAAADDPAVAWAAVRPGSLFDEDERSPATPSPSLTRSPFFGAGRTSRLAVAHFMAELMTEDETWARWRGRMPELLGAATGEEGAAAEG